MLQPHENWENKFDMGEKNSQGNNRRLSLKNQILSLITGKTR